MELSGLCGAVCADDLVWGRSEVSQSERRRWRVALLPSVEFAQPPLDFTLSAGLQPSNNTFVAIASAAPIRFADIGFIEPHVPSNRLSFL